MKINGQVAVITGGGSGMGAETAQYLAKAGAKVAILDKDPESGRLTALSINAFSIACDVTDGDQVKNAFIQIEQRLGVPRICINCAGIAPAKLIVAKDNTAMPLENFTQVIQINLIGTFNVLRIAAAAMSTMAPLEEDQQRGVIINTASVAAFEGQIGQAAYSASKGGIVAMTLPAARELATHGIRVVTIAPGLIDTPLLQGLSDSVRANLAASVPFPQRLGTTREYAKLVAHIIDNNLLNGTVIRLDGALRMGSK